MADDNNLNLVLKAFYSKASPAPVLGDEAFIRSLNLSKPPKEIPYKKQVFNRPTIENITGEVAKLFEKDPSELLALRKGPQQTSNARKMALYIAKKHEGYRLEELKDIFGFMNIGGISHAIYTFSQNMKDNPDLKVKLKQAIEKLNGI